jgi:hypothetical protein
MAEKKIRNNMLLRLNDVENDLVIFETPSFRIRTSVVFAGAFESVPCLIAAIIEVEPMRRIQTPCGLL